MSQDLEDLVSHSDKDEDQAEIIHQHHPRGSAARRKQTSEASDPFLVQSMNPEPDEFSRADKNVVVQLNRQPPPSRVGTRAAHKQINKNLTPAQQDIKNGQSPYQQATKIPEPQSRQDQILQQQQLQNMKNWPFYQNQKDARRGGTAPEGAKRAQMQQAQHSNPYGMVAGNEKGMMTSGAQMLKNSNMNDQPRQLPSSSQSNRSGASGAPSSQNGIQPAVTQSNQMIAKIYGKSNKFVINHHHGTSSGSHHLNDQYKKPKIQHMKDIIRQKTSQQKSDATSSGKPYTANQSQNGRNLRKIKIDNSKLKNMQTNQRKNQGSQMEKESHDIVARSTKNRANANRSQDFIEDNTSMIYHSKKQSTNLIESSQGQSRLEVVQEDQIGPNVINFTAQQSSDIENVQPDQVKLHSNQTRSVNRSRTSHTPDGFQNPTVESPRQNSQHSGQMQVSQGQGQGQGYQIGNQLRDEMKQIKNYQNKGRNQPIRGIHHNGPTKGTMEQEIVPSFEIEAEQVPNTTIKGFNRDQEFTEGGLGNTGEAYMYAAYAATNNIQFSAKDSSNFVDDLSGLHDRGTTPHAHKRSRQVSNFNNADFEASTYAADGQPDLETLGKFFGNNTVTSPSGEASGASTLNHAVDFSVAQQQYNEMKRLQTSQGPRTQKFRQGQLMGKGGTQVVQVQSILQDRPQERSQHERPERTERPQERQQPDRPPLTAPSSQMQRMQHNQKNSEVNAGKKIAKIKGKLSNQFQMASLAGTGGDGLDLIANTIQNNPTQPDHGFDQGNESNDANERYAGGAQGPYLFSRTIDTTPNAQTRSQPKVLNGGLGAHGQTPHGSTVPKTAGTPAASNSQPQTPGPHSIPDHKNAGDNQQKGMPMSTKAGQTNVEEGTAPPPGGQGSGPTGAVAIMPHQAATLGYQFEQWQRPPSRQKEPNQALGLDDARPKTRGGGGNSLGGPPANISTHFGGHQNHTSHMSGRDRKRNIQKFIPASQTGVLSVSNMYQPGPQDAASTQGGGRNASSTVNGPQASGTRPRMIDFFHQRNNNINGFNSTGDQTQYFQTQYQQQPKSNSNQAAPAQQATFDDRSEFSPLQGHAAPPQTHAGTSSTQQNPRRGGQAAPGHGAHGSSQQRPPSRHKDPPQNLGLDLYPPGVGFASPDEFGPPLFGGAHTPAGHASLGGPSMGGGIVGLDVDSDLENGYDAVGPESDMGLENLEAIDLENAGYFWGHGRGGAAPLQKQFKEDEDDFFDSQFHQQARFSEGIEKAEKPERPERRHNQTQKAAKFARQPSEGSNQIKYHPRGGPGHGSHQSVGGAPTHPSSQNHLGQPMVQPQQQFAQTYGHGMSLGPMAPGTAPGPGLQNQQFQYHPALQQTQNFYIGMNQIIPQGSNQDASALANDFFSMSANVSNLVNGATQPPKTAGMHQSKRGQSSGGAQAFHSTGFVQTEGASHHLHHHSNQLNEEMLSRGFLNQRSPVNERSGAIQHLVLQNTHLKNMNKPKSASGNRISGNKNRFKNLNNSGRFVGQNSTIIHSAYNNQNRQHLKLYSKPKAGGWIGDGSQTNSGTKNIGNTNSGAQTSKSKQQQKIKPGTSAGTINGGRGQLFLSGDSTHQDNGNNINNSNSNNDNNQNQQAPSNDNIKEIIKIGQEINFNRPKESKGQRSTEKRHMNNQSLGVTSSTGPGLVQGNNTNSQATHGTRNPKNGNFVSSPLSGGTNINSNQNFKTSHHSSKNASGKEMFSQTTKFQNGPSGGLQQSSMGVATDKLTDLTDLIPNMNGGNDAVQGLTGFQSANQNSFKSQTLQFPNSFNSQLGDDFINLFAN